VGNRAGERESLEFAILAEQSHALPPALRGRRGTAEDADAELPRTDWIEPEQCAQEFRATGADQTGNANDLPTMKRERGLDRFASAGEARALEDDVTRTSRGAGIKVMHVTADHVSNDRGM